MEDITFPKTISEAQAAKLLGFAKQWLADLRTRGEGPKYYKLGGRIRYDPQDVRDFLDACQHDPQKD